MTPPVLASSYESASLLADESTIPPNGAEDSEFTLVMCFLPTERQVQPRQVEDTHWEQKRPSRKRKRISPNCKI